MTALVTSLASMPIASGIGEGAAMLRPMAVAIIAGLVVELPSPLLVLRVAPRLVAGAPAGPLAPRAEDQGGMIG